MNIRHLVAPDLLATLDVFPAFAVSAQTLPMLRSGIIPENPEAPTYPDIEVSERRVPGPPGAPEVRVLVYTPRQATSPVPALLWIHGGGYVLGTADGDDLTVKAMVAELGCAAVSVDYRLAPETPAPGNVEDCYAALSWLYHNAAPLGVDASRIAIGGASAGGGLAAALGLLTRDRGEVPLCFQLLIYPMLDDRTVTHPDPHPHVGEFIWTHESNAFGWASLLGHAPGQMDESPYAVPARAENLAGLPPTWIGVGALDLFLEEDLDYARKLTRCGVATELHMYPGAYHGFNMNPQAQATRDFNADILTALGRAFALPSP